ncbi:MAG: TetR/AcrR family transcriptional regulator [Acidobacteriota bacterium]|nr:TetR/AcrR family transcriptional regulator [Acidobacteriota bacterium]
MPKKSIRPATRKPRADAERNRSRILEVAKEAFTRHGAEASLDDIAKQAEVGPGTLYRHFPNRSALIEAVYRSEVEKLVAAGNAFANSKPPLDALRAWMLLFIDHIAAKHIIAPALNSVEGGASRLYEGSRASIRGVMESLVKSAVKSGDLRKDIRSEDLIQPLIGVFFLGTGPQSQQSARRLVDILIAGSRSLK